MKHSKFEITVLIVFLAAGIVGIFVFPPIVSSTNSTAPAAKGILPVMTSSSARATYEWKLPASARSTLNSPQEIDLPASGWEQVNINGFGDPQTGEIPALAAFNGYLYAGTHNPIDPPPAPLYDGAQIFRAADGLSWDPVTEPGFGIAHDIAPPAILDFLVFNNRLYASTGRGDGPGQIWRSVNGVTWAPMIIHGFNDEDNVDITALAEYNGMIFAGVTNLNTGAQIWSSYTGDNNTWTQVAPTVPGTDVASITGFAVFDGALYAVVESAAPAQVWLTYGGPWITVVDDGFGDSDTISTGGMVEFGGYLYIGAGNDVAGAQLWRTNDGSDWAQIISPGFGDSNNVKIELVFVFQNYLYVSVKNMVTGMEIWRSPDGVSWEQANQDGFGDNNNTGTNWSNAAENFLSDFYVGTVNVMDGGELWRLQQQQPTYSVKLSPDDVKNGAAGQVLTYTLQITNTGTSTDTFDLTLAGNAWQTELDMAQVTLATGESRGFSVVVNVPLTGLGHESDTATITAVSQGDPDVTDQTHLTSTIPAYYGVALSGNQTQSAPAGMTVAYTLSLTNTGNTTDIILVSAGGNSWLTTVITEDFMLAPGATGEVLVQVVIPGNAGGNQSDTATITAISTTDGAQFDTAALTTTATTSVPMYKSYLPTMQFQENTNSYCILGRKRILCI